MIAFLLYQGLKPAVAIPLGLAGDLIIAKMLITALAV